MIGDAWTQSLNVGSIITSLLIIGAGILALLSESGRSSKHQ